MFNALPIRESNCTVCWNKLFLSHIMLFRPALCFDWSHMTRSSAGWSVYTQNTETDCQKKTKVKDIQMLQ
jgi:hypothetical protein